MASLDNYSNEGFLYINTKEKDTFKKGEIVDGDMKVICPGVIVPIIPILEKQRDVGESDKHSISLENCLDKITHYCPLQKGKKLRIYWNQNHETFMVSTESTIYPCYEEAFDLSTVNFELLDKDCCYYALVHNNSSNSKTIVTLINIVDKENPDLQGSYNIDHDLAFEHHAELFSIQEENILPLLNELETFKNGIQFILSNGLQLELRTSSYNYHCSLAKPDNMCITIYYSLCLNREAEGENSLDYFISLHDYVSEFVEAYPEYIGVCESMSEKLLNYIEKHDMFDNIEAIFKLPTETLAQLVF